MSTKRNFVELALDAPLSSTDATINATISKRYRRGQDSGGLPQYYDLLGDGSASLPTNFRAEIFEKGGERVESVGFASVATNGTTSDGRQKYTFTFADDGGTKIRGLDNDNDGSLVASNVEADNIVDNFPEGSTMKITWEVGEQNRLEDVFESTTNIFNKNADGAITKGDIVHINGSLFKTGLGTSDEWFGVALATVADGESVDVARSYATGIGVALGVALAANGDKIYWDDTGGEYTTSSSGNVLVGEQVTASSLSLFKTEAGVNLSQAQAEDDTDTNFGLVSGERLGEAIEANSNITQNTATDVSGNSWVIDEDDMSSDDATKVPTQQSVKAYVDSQAGGTKAQVTATSGTVTPTSAVNTKLINFTELYDSGGDFSISTDLFTAPRTSLYKVDWGSFANQSGVQLRLIKNGTTVIQSITMGSTSAYDGFSSNCTFVELTASDTLGLYAYDTSSPYAYYGEGFLTVEEK